MGAGFDWARPRIVYLRVFGSRTRYKYKRAVRLPFDAMIFIRWPKQQCTKLPFHISYKESPDEIYRRRGEWHFLLVGLGGLAKGPRMIIFSPARVSA